jgi:hypothetical protein
MLVNNLGRPDNPLDLPMAEGAPEAVAADMVEAEDMMEVGDMVEVEAEGESNLNVVKYRYGLVPQSIP